MTDREQLRDQGRRRRDEGVGLAAMKRRRRVLEGQIDFLDALLQSRDRTASIDDSTQDLDQEFDDGGRWRGAIPLALSKRKLVAKVETVTSSRPSRHAGNVTKWRAIVNDRVLEQHRERLQRQLGDLLDDMEDVEEPAPPPPPPRLGLFGLPVGDKKRRKFA